MNFKYKPLSEWINAETPQLWKDHNSLKHNRYTNYSLSNLKNALFAMESLMIINMYLNKEIINWHNVNVDRLPILIDAEYLRDRVFTKESENLPTISDFQPLTLHLCRGLEVNEMISLYWKSSYMF